MSLPQTLHYSETKPMLAAEQSTTSTADGRFEEHRRRDTPAVTPTQTLLCTYHERYLILARLCAAIACLSCLGSIVTAATVFYISATQDPGDEGRSFDWGIITTLYFLVFIESLLCLVCMLVCLFLSFCSPQRVLMPAAHRGALVCLCITVSLLFIFSIYSALVPVSNFDWDPRIMPPPISCIVPCIRMIALTGFLCVLIANATTPYPNECAQNQAQDV